MANELINETISVNGILDFFENPYLNNQGFTLDPKEFIFKTSEVNTYFQFNVTIKTYDFFTNVEHINIVPQKVVVFKGKSKLNIGKLIHRLMRNFSEVNNTLVQYQKAEVSLAIYEKRIADETVLRFNTSQKIYFTAGLSRGITDTGILDFNPKPNRVTKNSFAYINILIPKPVNCVVSEWSAWSECVDGSQTRTRTVITPASNGGTACPILLETRACTPINCVVSEWSEWSECVNGSQTRTRTVITPASNGGTACPVLSESRSCEVDPTPVNCVVSEWSAWSECVDGSQTRTRTVITTAANGGTACPVLSETRSCVENASITYLVNLSGGISPGSFSISVNGNNAFTTNQTDSGVINAPIGSLIQVNIYAPTGDTSGNETLDFYSNVYAQDASGVIATSGSTNNTYSTIEFTVTAETSIYASASVSSGNGQVIQ